MIRRRQSCSFH